MLVESKRGGTEVRTLAYFKNNEERKLAVEKIKKRRKSFIIYKLLPKEEKKKVLKRFYKYARLNSDKLKKIAKKWREKNTQKVREFNKKSRLKYPEKIAPRYWSYYHRKEILEAKGEKCKKCNSVENLEIHHKKYTNNLEDLEILCRKCHKKLDRKYSDKQLGIEG